MGKRKTVDIVTMGCSKNLVDSERLIHLFEKADFVARHNPEILSADYVVINTCGFIGDAKQESIDMILQCCQAKGRGEVGRVIVMGCLSERYREDLPPEIPEVDLWYGKYDWTGLVNHLRGGNATKVADSGRVLTTPGHYAYIKIAEGCNRFCAFCAIPLITGRYKSRPIEEICDEMRQLVRQGVKEFNIIAQDLTYYGEDLYGRKRIADLVDAMAEIEGVEWIRLHYAYPADFPYDLLDSMARHPNVCKYLDIALQHVSDNVLSNMRRHIDGAGTRRLLERIREAVPGIHIRTTLMVGFPGEGEEEFAELLDFVKEQKFERMGAFAYCEEDDTYAAAHFKDRIPQEIKERRLSKLMELQEEISLISNEEKIGKETDVIIDAENDDFYLGRTQYDSPEVDLEVLVPKRRKLNAGDIVKVRITKAYPFEIEAELV